MEIKAKSNKSISAASKKSVGALTSPQKKIPNKKQAISESNQLSILSFISNSPAKSATKPTINKPTELVSTKTKAKVIEDTTKSTEIISAEQVFKSTNVSGLNNIADTVTDNKENQEKINTTSNYNTTLTSTELCKNTPLDKIDLKDQPEEVTTDDATETEIANLFERYKSNSSCFHLIASALANRVTAERVAKILFVKGLINVNTVRQNKYKLGESHTQQTLNVEELEKLCEYILKEKTGTNALRWLKERLEEARAIMFGDELIGTARHEMVVFPEFDSGLYYMEHSIHMQKLVNVLDIKPKEVSKDKSKWVLLEHIAADQVQIVAETISSALKNFKKPLSEKEELSLLWKEAKEIDDFVLAEEDDEEAPAPAVKKSKLETKTKKHTSNLPLPPEQHEIAELDRLFGGKTKKRKL